MITKTYLPIAVKKQIVDMIVNNSIIERDGMKFIDFISKDIATSLAIVQQYTDIDLDEVDFDNLAESGELEDIKTQIPEHELLTIELAVDSMLHQEIDTYNSLPGVINRQLSNLISKIPDSKEMTKILKSLPKSLEKVSPETLELLKGLMNKEIK